MLDLVPFQYSEFKASETVWPGARSVRFPRAEVGRIFGATGQRPELVVNRIVNRHPHLKSLGVDLPVRSTDRKLYRTKVYDFREILTIAAYSKLPGARRYILLFPVLLEAEVLGRLSKPKHDINAAAPLVENLDAVLSIPGRTKERWEAKRLLCDMLGKSKPTIDRYLRKRQIGDIPPLRRGRCDKGSPRKFPADLQEKTRLILEYQPNISTRELQSRLDGKVHHSTLRRYRLALKLGH